MAGKAGEAGSGTTDTGAQGSQTAGDQGKGGAQGDAGKQGNQQGSQDDKAGGTGDGQGGKQGNTGDTGKGGTGEAQKAGDKGAQGDAPKPPDKYELAVPDDAKDLVDTEDLKYLETVARQAGWTNEDAQAALEEHLATIAAQSTRYLETTKADPTYGGEKLAETQRLAKAAIDRIRPAGHERRDSFLRFMNRGGAGNHIEVLSFLADLGRMTQEDSPGQGGASSGGAGGRDAAATLYDHPTSKALEGR